jgi:catechol 2,3-dioxygenase-like lactoylglutathione lyase family enzyme
MEFGQLHHVEYFVNDFSRSNEFWSWFLPTMGYSKFQEFAEGISWSHKNGTYLVFCQVEKKHLNANNTRQGNGLNHIAFMGGSLAELDQLQRELEDRKVKILKRNGDYLCFEDPNEFAVEVYAKDVEQSS